VRLLGSMGNREMTFAVGKVSCEWTEKEVMLTNWEFYCTMCLMDNIEYEVHVIFSCCYY
jgi:hypothetical protein